MVFQSTGLHILHLRQGPLASVDAVVLCILSLIIKIMHEVELIYTFIHL